MVPPLGLSAKARRMEQDGWAATPWGVGVGERSSQTQSEVLIRHRGPHPTEVLSMREDLLINIYISLDVNNTGGISVFRAAEKKKRALGVQSEPGSSSPFYLT